MDINELFSIIEEKELYTEETISEVKKLIENFPYFQTGHMLLLKAMHASKSGKFNDQLNISGSFIPDKIRLFKFINTTKEISKDTKVEETRKPKKYLTETPKKISNEPKIRESKSFDIKKDIQTDKIKLVKNRRN